MWGHTGVVTQNALHSITHWSRDGHWSHEHNSQGNTQARPLSPPTSYVVAVTRTHQPQQNETLTHTHTRLATHQHNPQGHTQRQQTTHADTPSDKHRACAGAPPRGTHMVPTWRETWQESDRDTPGCTQIPRVCPLGENAASGCSRGCSRATPATCHPGAQVCPLSSLSSPKVPSSVSPTLEAPGFVLISVFLSFMPLYLSVSSGRLSL